MGTTVMDSIIEVNGPYITATYKTYHYQIPFFGLAQNFGLTCYNYAGFVSGARVILFEHDGRKLGRTVSVYSDISDGFLPDLVRPLAQSEDPDIIPILFGRR